MKNKCQHGWLQAAFALLMLGALPTGCQVKPSEDAKSADQATEAIRSPGVPPAKYISGKSGEFILESYRGHPLLLSVQGAATPYLAENLRQLDQLSQEWVPRGLAVVGLLTAFAEGEDPAARSVEFNLSYPLAAGTPDFVKTVAPVRALPTLLLVDASGAVRKQYPGAFSADVVVSDLKGLLTAP